VADAGPGLRMGAEAALVVTPPAVVPPLVVDTAAENVVLGVPAVTEPVPTVVDPCGWPGAVDVETTPATVGGGERASFPSPPQPARTIATQDPIVRIRT
jgi:hypothetical protein